MSKKTKNSKKRDYAVFIVSHKRPDKIYTLSILEKCWYTGDTYIVIDDEDDTVEQYKEIHWDSLIVFDKKKASECTDTYDNQKKLRGLVYARNAMFDIAKERGYDYFLVLDDDYTEFSIRYNSEDQFGYWRVNDLDRLFELFLSILGIQMHSA